MILVHVPEDEFPSDEEDFVMTDNVEVRQVVMHQVPGGVSVGGRPLGTPIIPCDDADVAARRANVQRMKEDLLFKEMVGQAVAEQIRIEKEKEKEGIRGNDKQVMAFEQPISNVINGVAQIKSPSDTMIYAQTLNRSPTAIGKINNPTSVGVTHVANQGACNTVMSNDIRLLNQVSDQGEAINKITEFLESMRLNVVQGGDSSDGPRPGGSRQVVADDVNIGPGRQDVLIDHHDENGETQGHSIAKQMVVDAEKCKATIDRIEGKQVTYPVNYQLQTIDDEFFHLMCHVDMSLVPKIERGEFVDLEKLLPKDPTKKLGEDGRMELTNKDGSLFFVPAVDREQGKISGIRKWEQAFHVYAEIYSRANPQRSAEIWQYVYIINLASTSYSCDNVACYDYTFRQLMGRHPGRSWSTIFQQSVVYP